MDTFVIGHPIVAICLVLVPLLGVITIVWRAKPSIRIIATALGFCWAVAGSAYLAYLLTDTGHLLDRKNFIYLPTTRILSDISDSADSGDLDLTKRQLEELERNWHTICMTTNDPWVIQETISGMETNNRKQGIAEGLGEP